MGDQIEFPKNFNMYMTRVMEHLREGDVINAINYMKKAYAIKEEDTLNVLLVSSLLQAGEHEEALNIATEKESFYTSDEKRLLIFVEILLENNQVLLAEKYIKDQLSSEAVNYSDSWKRLDSRLTEIKKVQDDNRRKAEEKIVRDLYSLASLNTLEQFSLMNKVYSLPNARLKELAPQLLVNPYVHPLVRATLYSLLSERGVNSDYSYLWFGDVKKGNPANTLPIEESPTAVRMEAELDARLSKDPSLFQLAKNESDTLLLMLYPFEEEVIERGSEGMWIMSIIQTLNPGSRVELTENVNNNEHVLSWIEKIHSELLRFE